MNKHAIINGLVTPFTMATAKEYVELEPDETELVQELAEDGVFIDSGFQAVDGADPSVFLKSGKPVIERGIKTKSTLKALRSARDKRSKR